MSRNQVIILGFGREDMNEVVKEAIAEYGIGRVAGIAMLRKNIVTRVTEHGANMVIIDEHLVGEQENDEEWIDIIEELRRVDMYIRIVFVCNRPEDDIFLTKLAIQGVTDIFHEGKLSNGWQDQLIQAPRFDATERFRKQADKATEQLRKRKRHEHVSPEEILEQIHVPKQEKKQLKVETAAAEKTESVHKKEEKVRVVEKRVKEKQIIVERVNIPSRSVVVLSLFEGAGSSMLTKMLAEHIASLQVDVGVLESPVGPPAWFEIINAWGLFDGGKGFIPRREAITRQQLRQLIDLPVWECWHETLFRDEEEPAWSDVLQKEDVKYIIRDPKADLEGWHEADSAHLLAYSRHLSLLFCDVSTHYDDPNVQILLRTADLILVVGGYDVVRTERAHKKYQDVLGRFYDKVHLIMNKSTPRIERIHGSEMKSIYGVKYLFHVPAMTEICELYIEGDSFWKASYIREEKKVQMRSIMDELTKIILGEEVQKKLRSRQKSGFWHRVGSWFTHDEKEVEIDEGTA